MKALLKIFIGLIVLAIMTVGLYYLGVFTISVFSLDSNPDFRVPTCIGEYWLFGTGIMILIAIILFFAFELGQVLFIEIWKDND